MKKKSKLNLKEAEIIKIRAEINETRTLQTIEKNQGKPKAGSLKRSVKLTNL